MRIIMFVLCALLAAAAAGRYQAEVQVKQKRAEIRTLQADKAREAREIQILRAEIAYLESPERLERIARENTALKPVTGAQLMTADDFAVALGGPAADAPAFAAPAPTRRRSPGAVPQAVAMVDASTTP
ncbi:MAG: hypothetical protein AAGC56_13560 [Pseudomonadota bacterium]